MQLLITLVRMIFSNSERSNHQANNSCCLSTLAPKPPPSFKRGTGMDIHGLESLPENRVNAAFCPRWRSFNFKKSASRLPPRLRCCMRGRAPLRGSEAPPLLIRSASPYSYPAKSSGAHGFWRQAQITPILHLRDFRGIREKHRGEVSSHGRRDHCCMKMGGKFPR
ncbi:hypothetical protein ASPVEDRAFT_804933 [Aspergillus versicolor CBS 583.65]|uniref:Uncharacterized protein n=1 Tax=Aspergillus versicolor CBS 583.65 TaxID=1036611 RepID=A0A1L9PSZ3_ASPVE|nr:uncharacterized protein ASPVEDRAFT_804933 [Aspergillus versicolor CBS 583.65]OJJ04631.1 hypothetical protein ASPVEDRAFT_804933 [Aspergillus versicolor CBS 583.65]